VGHDLTARGRLTHCGLYPCTLLGSGCICAGSGLGLAGSRHSSRSGVYTNASTVAALVPCGQSSDSISRLRISPGPRHRFRCRGDWTSVECPVGRSGGSDSSFDHVGRRLVAACPCGTCGRGIAVRGFPLAVSAAHRPPVRAGGAASDVYPVG